jgi:REP element-mobilizing transposase RayT
MLKMVAVLDECSKLTGTKIHAYCLMSNHAHLLVQICSEPDGGSKMLAQVMKRIEIRYARYYNFKYNRIGALFQDRYRSEAVETDAYYLTVLRYIHRNPVVAGIAKSPSKYEWSSYRAYSAKGDVQGLTGFVYTDFGKTLLDGQFESYVDECDDADCMDMDDDRRMTDMELSSKIEEALGIPAPTISALERKEVKEALQRIYGIKGVSYRQISRVTGIPLSTVFRAAN